MNSFRNDATLLDQCRHRRSERRGFGVLALFASLALLPAYASASLVTFNSFVGSVGVSTDGFGSTAGSGTISASVPTGSTVLEAYLYSSFSPGSFSAPSGSLNGVAVTYTPLGANSNNLQAGRARVTSIVAPLINGGPGGVYNFTVTESFSTGTDGEALVVIYSNPLLPMATVGIVDGFSSDGGDTTTVNFALPLDPLNPAFFAEMRLGIGFSCCSEYLTFDQRSTVQVNGSTLTTVAGDKDDGLIPANGSLITVGGFDDPFSPINTSPSLAAYIADHERYNLVPFVTAGSTSISIRTLNPGASDNIFLSVIRVSGQAGINALPAADLSAVPEPGSLMLLGGGLALLAARRRWQRKSPTSPE